MEKKPFALTPEEVEVLETARDLLAPPEAFSDPGAIARDASGKPVLAQHASAVGWSLVGAIRLAYELLHSHGDRAPSSLTLRLVVKLRESFGVRLVAQTHAQAIAIIKELLALPREGESLT